MKRNQLLPKYEFVTLFNQNMNPFYIFYYLYNEARLKYKNVRLQRYVNQIC